MNRESLLLNGEKFFTHSEVMEMFGISRVTLWKWVKNGLIRQHHIGKFTYYLEKELSEDIKRSGTAIRRTQRKANA